MIKKKKEQKWKFWKEKICNSTLNEINSRLDTVDETMRLKT